MPWFFCDLFAISFVEIHGKKPPTAAPTVTGIFRLCATIPGDRKKAPFDMSVFEVTSLTPNAELGAKILATYHADSYALSETVWFVSDKDVTAAQVCEKLGVRTANAVTGFTDVVVVRVHGYFGHATSAVWQWLQIKGALP